MGEFFLEAKSLRKDFGRRIIFENVSFSLSTQDSLSIVGPNGSGKTTLLKILGGLLTPTAGTVEMREGDGPFEKEDRRHHIGFVAPYLQLYNEFTAYENLSLAASIRGSVEIRTRIEKLLKRVDLVHRRDDRVGTFSSGMKQRLKFAFAILHSPALLLLDEPMSNLDDAGKEMVGSIIDEQKQSGLLVVATNDAQEARTCSVCLQLRVGSTVHLNRFS